MSNWPEPSLSIVFVTTQHFVRTSEIVEVSGNFDGTAMTEVTGMVGESSTWESDQGSQSASHVQSGLLHSAGRSESSDLSDSSDRSESFVLLQSSRASRLDWTNPELSVPLGEPSSPEESEPASVISADPDGLPLSSLTHPWRLHLPCSAARQQSQAQCLLDHRFSGPSSQSPHFL